MLYKFIGMWAIRRAWRLLSADDARPLQQRLTHEAKRILVGAAITLVLLFIAVVVGIAVLIAVVT